MTALRTRLTLSRVSAGTLLLGFGVLVVAASESAFYIASGSDLGVTIHAPTLTLKLVALGIFGAAVAVALFAQRMRWWWRPAIATGGLIVLALGTHAVVFNRLDRSIQEFWLLSTVDRAAYNIAEGVRFDWDINEAILGLQLKNKVSHEEVFVFCGVPPWRVDPSASLGPPE
jgi:hypothetical protein